MKPSPISVAMLLVSLFLVPVGWAQTPAAANQSAASSAASAAEVPRLIKFSGTLLDAQDRPLAGPVGVTFALYSQQTGGAALWMETQNVTPDAHGVYTVLLGANSANGVPAELFASGEARWLEVQVERQAEQPRVLLVSVPYALKAGDAQTLGGKPASAYALARGAVSLVTSTSGTATGGAALAAGTSGPQPLNTGTTPVTTAGGTVGNLAMFDGNADITNAVISENGSGQVSIGGAPSTNAKLFLTDTQTDFGTKWLQQGLFITNATKNGSNAALTFDMDMTNMSISPGVTDSGSRLAFRSLAYANTTGFKGALNQQIGILAQAGIRSATSGAVVNLAYGGQFTILNQVPGTTINNAYGVWIKNSDTAGTITNRYDLYASSPNANNFFAGKVGIGTATPVANLEVNGTTKFDALVTFAGGQTFPGTGSVTSVGSGLGLTGGPITGSGTLAINPTVVPQLTASSNTFTGSISASSFSGSGSGLTGVNATTATSFTGSLGGEVTGTQSATVVSSAVVPNTANAIVRRDGSGNFSAGTVTLAGNLALPSTASSSVGVLTLGGASFLHNFGTNNTFLGTSAGNTSASLTGTDNTAVGASALSANTTGNFNAAFGANALKANTTGFNNSAFGALALTSTTTGNSNSAFGLDGLAANTTGSSNSAFGFNSLRSNTMGIENDAFGEDALAANTTGSNNVAFGFQALGGLGFGGGTGDSNIGIGSQAGQSLTTGSNNIYIGNQGASSESNIIRIGSGQTSTFLAGTVRATSFVGDGSGLTGIAALGGSNTFSGLETFTAAPSGGGVGQGSLYINPTSASTGQTLLGAAVNNVQQMRLDSGGNLTLAGTLGLPNTNGAGTAGVVFLGGTRFLHNFGTGNTFLGASAGNTSMPGTFNAGVGFSALASNTTGGGNAAFGPNSLQVNTTGSGNSAFGNSALQANSSASHNSAFGSNALLSNTTGSNNSAFGFQGLDSNTTGSNNSAFGFQALVFNNADNNAAFGSSALQGNTIGSQNSAFGELALKSNTMGSSNVAFGFDALLSNTTGFNNTTVGSGAGLTANSANANTTGFDNTFLGFQAGPGTSTQLTNATAIGANALVSASNAMTLGDGTINVGIGTQTPLGRLEVQGGADGSGANDPQAVALAYRLGGFRHWIRTRHSAALGSNNAIDFFVNNSTLAGGSTGPGSRSLEVMTLDSGKVGIGTQTPVAILDVETGTIGTGLRVGVVGTGGVLASFGGNGDFQIDAPGVPGGRFIVKDSSGNVGIGTAAPAHTLEVKAGGTTLADAWTTRSSARFKTNVQPLLGALAKVQQLRGVSYDLRATGKHQIGLIAEEVAQVVPEIVAFEPNGKDAQGLDYARLTALLIEAVKQQQVQISEQQMLMSRQQEQLQMQRAEIGQLASQVRLMQGSLRGTHQSSAARTTKTHKPAGHAGTTHMVAAAQAGK